MKPFLILLFFLMFAACTAQPALQTTPLPSPPPAETTIPQPTATSAPADTTPAEELEPEATRTPQEPESSPASSETQTQTAAADESKAPPASESEVQIETGDGLLISGTFYPASGEPPWPGVLLLHMVDGDRSQWDDLVPQLTKNGYAVLAIDQRGHGKTGGDVDWEKAGVDALDVWRYLSGRDDVDGGKTSLAGGSIGANLSLAAASKEAGINTVVLLSPGLDYRGVTTLDALGGYGERALFLAASSEDSYAADSARTLAESASGESELHMFEGAGHGTQMLAKEPQLIQLILDWLGRHAQ